MDKVFSRIGAIDKQFGYFKLKDALTKNDAGDWGDEPNENALGIIRSTNFTNEGKLNLEDVAYRTLKPSKQIEKKLYENEILIERSGGSDKQPVGRVGLITPEISQGDFAFANFIQRIALDDTIAPRFLYYCLQQMYEMGITKAMQYQTTGIRNLDWKLFTKSLLPKPPKPEQTAIATILSKVDETIEATQKSIKAAEKLKKALMQNLLTGKLKPDGTWRSEDEFWEDEKFGKVPVGWEWKRIKNVTSEVQYGLNVSSVENGRYPMFRMNNIIDGKMVSKPMVHVNLSQKDFEKYRVKHGDILFNRTNSLDLVGKVGIYDLEDTDYVFASYLIKLCVDQENDPYFINYFLNSYTGQSSLRSKATPAVSQANINAKSLRNTFVLCPSKDEQIEIVKKLKSVELSKIDKQSKIKSLQRLKKSLMQNLLTGKVRLPEKFIKQFEVEENDKEFIAE